MFEFYLCQITKWIEAVLMVVSSQSGPDCLTAVIPALGVRLKVYHTIGGTVWIELGICFIKCTLKKRKRAERGSREAIFRTWEHNWHGICALRGILLDVPKTTVAFIHDCMLTISLCRRFLQLYPAHPSVSNASLHEMYSFFVFCDTCISFVLDKEEPA